MLFRLHAARSTDGRIYTGSSLARLDISTIDESEEDEYGKSQIKERTLKEYKSLVVGNYLPN